MKGFQEKMTTFALDMKPMIKYRGGKSKEIPQFINYIPDYQGRYIEPFLGGGAVFFHLEPQTAIINDINNKLITFYQEVQQNFHHLKAELAHLEEIYTTNREAFETRKKAHPTQRVHDDNEDLYYRLRDMYNGLTPSEYSDAALYFYINKTAYSGMIRFNRNGEYNVPYGRYKNFNTSLITERHSELLQRTQIFNTDYHDIFNMTQQGDFMFLDPPYDCIFSDYGNEEYREGFNEENHRELAQAFRNLGCQTMMVIGSTPLTRELYGNNIIGEYNKNYAVNIRNRFQAAAKHIIVTNYEV